MVEVRYFDGQMVHVGDTIRHKVYPAGPYTEVVTKITRSRVYYKQNDSSYEFWYRHDQISKNFLLTSRGPGYKRPPSMSGFAKFVRGCDEGKYGNKPKRKYTRKPKEEKEAA